MSLGQDIALTSIHGLKLGLGVKGNLVAQGTSITSNAVDVSIAVAASQTSPRAITIQALNADGTNIAHAQLLEIDVFLDAAGVAWAVTGGSTGIAVGASGALITVLSKLSFRAHTTITGLLALTWTDTAHEVAFLGVKMPSGRTVYSAALTTA